VADVVVDVTAKAPTALTQAIALARPAATVVVAGRAALDPLISGRYPFETCRGAACASKIPRNCWLPWPMNAMVSRQYTEC
jgi:threonine dehydrogenase-like Zn-dependent dehydrogenase